MTVRNVERRTRVLVVPHNFELGGSQINALELISEVARDPGFEVIVYAPDGELVERARRIGVELHLTKLRESALSLRRIHDLRKLIRTRGIDVIHTYEWVPTVDAVFAAGVGVGVPLVSTILSMDYPYFIPSTVPLVLGTQQLVDRARGEGRVARLIEPPVDTEEFRPNACGPDEIAAARAECGAGQDDDLVVVVGRLAQALKLEGILTLVEAIGNLGRTAPVRLAIVGDGPERPAVQAAVDRANAHARRKVISLLGSRSEPLRYYLAADIAVGMGGSALRAMAVAKPLLVQGEQGFWAMADEQSLPQFLEHGWYGIGEGTGATERCTAELARMLALDESERAALGQFGRDLVMRRYSLQAAGLELRAVYADVVSMPRQTAFQRLVAAARLALELAKVRISTRFPRIQRKVRELRGHAITQQVGA
ncbi:glycosyltransferase [Microbacterium protaetiae]|uniref:D-inositol 3-phosphate glycosyltransferase n=1 Tax=Microbacterium protaetiae TaxID=2509458 RepID=A0A4P6ECL2_9MICO|nr:glycosyltransferase [Microbacterium protaetiae]QAY59970.1 glycosyltransferase [Microbacterium protaetiae]